MDTQLLQTKLHAPQSRRGLVLRPRRSERLSAGTRSRLTLVSAPPGFGKSTVVAEWVRGQPAGAVAWLSLDADDNDPATFWTVKAGAA